MAQKVKEKPKSKVSTVFKYHKNLVEASATVWMGFDISTYSIAGCAQSYDPITDKTFGPRWSITRWNKEDHSHWDKLKVLVSAYTFVHELQNLLGAGGIVRRLENLHIGVEELPARMLNSRTYREQAELTGAFVGGLLKWGFPNVHSVNVASWRSLVAFDLDIPIKEVDKFKTKEWAKEVYGAPNWPDLIRTNKKGLIPKPKGSNAKPSQSCDRYDATAIMTSIRQKTNSRKDK